MKRILVTGATGNIGRELVVNLCREHTDFEIIAAVRATDTAVEVFPKLKKLSFIWFDFEKPASFEDAFQNIDVLFLLRPPQLSRVNTYFVPLLASAKRRNIEKIVFLSVQGAEKSWIIPHNRIERLITNYGFDHIFIRPSYFMQNLTTILPNESTTVALPSGEAKFNWIDVKDIGAIAAVLILNFDTYRNRSYDITGSENKSYRQVLVLLNEITGSGFTFKSVNPFKFFLTKINSGMDTGFAFVFTLLHFLPRLQKAPAVSTTFYEITGKHPTSLREYIEREQSEFIEIYESCKNQSK